MSYSSKQAALKIVGHNLDGTREKDDFYATPTQTTRALLNIEKFRGKIWEPCCGEGHISRVLVEHGYSVRSTDLVDRGYGQPRVDFLLETRRCDNIITNPPYRNALEFAEKAVQLCDRKVALLLKLNFLEGIRRKSFFETRPPAWVYVFSQRQSLMKNGKPYKGGMMALAWFVWDSAQRQTRVGWI
jgi:hypothetical protein